MIQKRNRAHGKHERGQIVRRQGGQIIVEYVLLLAVAVTIGLIVITQLVKRDADDPENSGALVLKWRQIQDAIGQDNQN